MSGTFSMYQASLPGCSRALRILRELLTKAEAHAQAQGYEPAILLQSRLYPNMLPLLRQVQIATDISKGAAARLAGVEAPSFPDEETTFAELYVRIDRAVTYLASITPAQVDGSESREVTVKTPRGDLKFDGCTYLLTFVLPNIYFHVTTAYNILRHNGVPIGKLDYLGGQ